MKEYVIKEFVAEATMGNTAVFAVELFLQPDGTYRENKKLVANFSMPTEAVEYTRLKNELLEADNVKWHEDRAVILLKALQSRVQCDMDDIRASVGNVPRKNLEKYMAAAMHYMKTSGGQQFGA